jgi:hypothetical protein
MIVGPPILIALACLICSVGLTELAARVPVPDMSRRRFTDAMGNGSFQPAMPSGYPYPLRQVPQQRYVYPRYTNDIEYVFPNQ